MEEELDQHHIDRTSPLTEACLDVASLDPSDPTALLMPLPEPDGRGDRRGDGSRRGAGGGGRGEGGGGEGGEGRGEEGRGGEEKEEGQEADRKGQVQREGEGKGGDRAREDRGLQPTEAAGSPANLRQMTSTPVSGRPRTLGPGRLSSSPASLILGSQGDPRGSGCSAESLGVGVSVSVVQQSQEETGQQLRAPIVGYEIMEQRAKFTVFRIHVRRSDQENWLLFRRYTDFVRVNDKLKEIFPGFRLALPPKRWFGSNFDPIFLEDRQLGLQAFIDNIIGHKDIVLSGPVREFLCLDDPPGPHDSLEESRALCESLDETVYNLRMELAERDQKIAELTATLEEAQERIGQLMAGGQLPDGAKGVSKPKNTTDSSTPVSGENSTIEGDLHSQAEADQLLTFTQADVHRNGSPVLEARDEDLSPTQPGLGQDRDKDRDELAGVAQGDIITVT